MLIDSYTFNALFGLTNTFMSTINRLRGNENIKTAVRIGTDQKYHLHMVNRLVITHDRNFPLYIPPLVKKVRDVAYESVTASTDSDLLSNASSWESVTVVKQN